MNTDQCHFGICACSCQSPVIQSWTPAWNPPLSSCMIRRALCTANRLNIGLGVVSQFQSLDPEPCPSRGKHILVLIISTPVFVCPNISLWLKTCRVVYMEPHHVDYGGCYKNTILPSMGIYKVFVRSIMTLLRRATRWCNQRPYGSRYISSS